MPATQRNASTADTVLAAETPYDIPLLTRAAAHIEQAAIRNRETLGGSLENTDLAAGLRQLCVTAARPVGRQAPYGVGHVQEVHAS
jgi:CO/xanthine dehydrogenase FAD-binding subunit